MDVEIQKAGATARSFGRSQFDNPYLKTETMPATSGDTIDEWKGKHDAWHLGWSMEDAMQR